MFGLVVEIKILLRFPGKDSGVIVQSEFNNVLANVYCTVS